MAKAELKLDAKDEVPPLRLDRAASCTLHGGSDRCLDPEKTYLDTEGLSDRLEVPAPPPVHLLQGAAPSEASGHRMSIGNAATD